MTELELDEALKAFAVPPPRPEWKRQMRRLAIAGLAACAALGAAFHDNKISSLSFGSPHATVEVATRVEPTYTKLRWFNLDTSISVSVNADWSARHLYDRKAGTAFGYELRAIPLGANRFRLEFQALRQDPRHGRYLGFRWTSPDSIPISRDVAANESVIVDLYRDGTDRLFDEVEVSSTAEPIDVRMRKAPLRIFSRKLYQDGNLIASNPGGGLSGTSLTLFIPGEKTIRLRLDAGPKNDHVPVGWVDGPILDVVVDGHRYRLESSEAITDSGRKQIFGLSKPNDEPKGQISFGSEG